MLDGIFIGSTGIVFGVALSAIVLDIGLDLKERHSSRRKALLGTRIALIELTKMIEDRSRVRRTGGCRGRSFPGFCSETEDLFLRELQSADH